MGRGYLRWLVLTWCWVAVFTQEEEEEKTEDLAEYTLIFKTANKKGAGTDGDVMMKLTGDHISMSYPIRYRGTGPKFGRGREDRFNLTDMTYIGPICSVQLWTKSTDSWILDTLTIVDWKTDDKAVFNVSKRIDAREQKYNRTEKADGKWSLWSDWSVCSGTCPTGSQSRTRDCSRPPPACGGGACQGVTNETQQCPLPECKKDKETTTPAETSKVSIILPIVIAVCVILVIIAVLVFRRKKKKRESEKSKEKSEQVVTYDKMHQQPDGTYTKNNYAA
ncbi:uncharacterized protein LOC135476460 [Liolophura sinensis]|uniref:uncharacterized protein LOC135476460 n=1 Tax=Liolophura sinensis TaxID=3198878 RepID=UPI0031583E6D